MTSPLAALLVALATVATSPAVEDATPAPAQGFKLHFIAGERIDHYVGPIERGLDWACSAELVIVQVTAIPADDGVLETDEIQELAPDGTVLATWRVPLEADPVAIEGDALTITDTLGKDDPHYLVGRDGSLAAATTLARPDEHAYSHCPANSLPESGYRWCVSLPDAATGKSRLIAFNGPCT